MQGAGASHDSWTAALRPAAWQQRMPQEARGRASRNSSTSSRSPAQQPAGSGSASPSSGGQAGPRARRPSVLLRCTRSASPSCAVPGPVGAAGREPGAALTARLRLHAADGAGQALQRLGCAGRASLRSWSGLCQAAHHRRRARRPPSSQPWQASPAAHRWSWRPLGRPRAGQRRTGGHLSVRGASRRGGRPLGIGVGDQQRRHGAKARGLGHAGQDARGLQAALLRRGGKRVWPPAVVTLQSAQACGSSPACRARADSSPAPSGSCCSCSRPGSAGSASPAAR